MRITHNLMVDRLLNNLWNTQDRLLKWHTRGSSGKRINDPSDDPAGTATTMRYRGALVEADRYARNANDAREWLTIADQAMTDMHQGLTRARELVILGASSTTTPESREALAAEVDQLLSHMVDLGNATYSGRYVFAGFKTTVPAFTRVDDFTIDYNGDNGQVQREIGKGVTLTVNIEGDAVMPLIFDVLIEARDAIRAGDTATLSGSVLQDLDTAQENLMNYHVRVGAAMERVELAEARQQDAQVLVSRLMSEIEDADVAEVLMRLSTEEAAYRYALAVGARIIQPSLVEYLR